jgi:hypothetical protein
MKKFLFAAALASAALTASWAAPAAAQGESWRHAESGISLPRSVGDMDLSREQDASGGGNYDVVLQYGDAETPVTVYVYRSAFPNAAMWFERTRHAMNIGVGAGTAPANPRSFTLGGASAPNGLREEISLEGGRAAGVAIAQVGQWMVKVRITSSRHDREAVAARMDRLLAALQFGRPAAAAHPLTVPAPCDGDVRMRGDRIRNVDERVLATASVWGLLGYGEARGMSGLAAEPAQWCRVTSTQLPAQFVSLYRHRDGTRWVALVGDAGRAVSVSPVDVPGDVRAVLFASGPASTQVVAAYDGLPNADQAVQVALPVVVGQARGIAEIGTEASDGPAPERPRARKN